MEPININLDRETYKKLQEIKLSTGIETISETITELVNLYGGIYKEKKSIESLNLSRKNINSQKERI